MGSLIYFFFEEKYFQFWLGKKNTPSTKSSYILDLFYLRMGLDGLRIKKSNNVCLLAKATP